MTPFVAIDFETAGYDPASACSLGVVAASEDGSVTEWHRLIRPPVMRFAPGCIAIHGIRPEDVEDKPEFPAFWPEIASLLRGRVVFAHNAQFDMGVLGATLDRYNLPEVPFAEATFVSAFIVRKALERSGTDDIEAMMRTQRQKLHTFRVHRTKQDYGLCGELL